MSTKNSNFTAVIKDEAIVEALTDYQWNNRLTRPELVRKAIDEFAAAHNIVAKPVEVAADQPELPAADAPDAPAETETPARTRR